MANTYSAFGMKPVQNGIVRTTEYYLPATDANTYAIGTPMQLAEGSNEATLINAKLCVANQYKNATKAVGGDTAALGSKLIGTVIGFDVFPTMVFADYSGYRPANQERIVSIADHPDQLFEIQVSGLTADDIGKNANIVIGAPDAFSRTDTSYLDLPAATTATFQVRIINVKPEIGNTVGEDNTQVAIVRINQHQLGFGTVGV